MYFYFTWPKMSGSEACGGGGAEGTLPSGEWGSGGGGSGELADSDGACVLAPTAAAATPAPCCEGEAGSARAQMYSDWNHEDKIRNNVDASSKNKVVLLDNASDSSGGKRDRSAETGECGEECLSLANGNGDLLKGASSINIDYKTSGSEPGENGGGRSLVMAVASGRTECAEGRGLQAAACKRRYSNGSKTENRVSKVSGTRNRAINLAAAVTKRPGSSLSRAPKRVCFTGEIPSAHCGIISGSGAGCSELEDPSFCSPPIEFKTSLAGSRHFKSHSEIPKPASWARSATVHISKRGSRCGVSSGFESPVTSNRIGVFPYSSAAKDSCVNYIDSSNGQEPRSAKGRVRLYRVRSFLTATAGCNSAGKGSSNANGCRGPQNGSSFCPALRPACASAPGISSVLYPGPQESQPGRQSCRSASSCLAQPCRPVSGGADGISGHGRNDGKEMWAAKGGPVLQNGVGLGFTSNGVSRVTWVPVAALARALRGGRRPPEAPSLRAVEAGAEEAGRRQGRLEERTERLWRRLQAVQGKQLERHVAQQLRGLAGTVARGRRGGGGAPLKHGALAPGTGEVARFAQSCTAALRTVESALDSDATASSSSGGESESEEIGERGGSVGPAPHTPHTLQESARWHWLEQRAELGSRWAWLQARVSDLEYRIRTQTELYTQLRHSKGSGVLQSQDSLLPRLPCPANGALHSPPDPLRARLQEEALAACPCPPDRSVTAARARPLPRHRRPRLVRLEGAAPLGSKTVHFRCCCEPPSGCVLCGGRPQLAESDWGWGSVCERQAMLDPCLHPVLSLPSDVPLAVQCGLSSLSTLHSQNPPWLLGEPPPPSWLENRGPGSQRLSRMKRKLELPQIPCHTLSHLLHTACGVRRNEKLQRSAASPSVLIPRAPSEPPLHTGPLPAVESPLSVPPQPSRRRRGESSFDINNMVMPLGLGGGARVQRLQYKEILTPSWRQLNCIFVPPVGQAAPGPGDGLASFERTAGEEEEEEEVEDLSDASFLCRHSASEDKERSRWGTWARRASQRRGRFSSRAESKVIPQPTGPVLPPLSPERSPGGQTEQPDTCPPSPPESEDTSCPLAEDEELAVLPWERRSFPLSEAELRLLKEEEERVPPPALSIGTAEDPSTTRSHSTDSGISVGSLELSPVTPQPPQPSQDLSPKLSPTPPAALSTQEFLSPPTMLSVNHKTVTQPHSPSFTHRPPPAATPGPLLTTSAPSPVVTTRCGHS
nr:PREDICTED: KAT8 regulatory NSL complex subunit 1-like isoform X2 [Lepisosteus oculatus]